jgi:hypothetical protein
MSFKYFRKLDVKKYLEKYGNISLSELIKILEGESHVE